MTVLEKIKRCVSLVWDFQEFYGEEDIEEFCRNELHTYPQHDEIMEYFKHIEELENQNKLLGERCNQLLKDKGDLTDRVSNQAESLRIIMLEEEKKYKQIEELEKENARLTTNEKSLLAERKIIVKENAELKEKIEVLECDNYNANCNLNLITDQLTKAKEFLKETQGYIENNDDNGDALYDEIEQLLKEIEK